MIVAGYSPKGSQIGVSSSLVAMAVWQYFKKERSILFVQAGFQSNLEETLLGMETWKRSEFFETTGIDELLRMAVIGTVDEKSIERVVLSLKQEGKVFDLLPATTKKNRTLYQKNLEQFLPILLPKLEQLYDVVYVDFGEGQEKICEQMQNLFQQIYVFLPQNRWILEEWNRKAVEGTNAKYKLVVPRYESDSIWNFHNLKWRYPRIGRSLVGTIPFDLTYMDCWSKGKAFDYLAIQCSLERRESSQVMQAVEQICQKIERKTWSGKKQEAV